MDREWLILPQYGNTVKTNDAYAKLLVMMDQVEAEKGYRFTDKQAEVIQKLITNLIDNIRSFKNNRKP